MEGGEGMVAVVRGLRDSGLAVTLLDGTRQYTLMPNSAQQSPQLHVVQGQTPPAQTQMPYPQSGTQQHQLSPRSQHSDFAEEQPLRCDSGAQATDGRYASMYKTFHCKVTPTSPPVQITEFPPQRAELCRGQGNFEVGGQGSGENFVPIRSNGSFRGGMSWPDRGSVCSPRQSREPDAFAKSLRKYPNLSMERSTEMVERLITYTQARNLTRGYQNRNPSPPRHGTDFNNSNFVLDQSMSRNTVTRPSSHQKNYEPEVNISAKTSPRLDESPTRDMRPMCDSDYRRLMKNNDKYCVPKVKENFKNFSAYPYNQPLVNQSMRGRYQNTNTTPVLTATNSVNMEVQAAAEMVSREVATVPRKEPLKRTVAVPLSPKSSSSDQKREGDVSLPSFTLKPTLKSAQTKNPPVDFTPSNIDIADPLHTCRYFIIQRRSKSEEHIKTDDRGEIHEILKKVPVYPNADPSACDLRREVVKEMSNRLQTMFENEGIDQDNEKTKSQKGKLFEYVPVWNPCGDVQEFKEAISDEIISKMKRYRIFSDNYRAETQLTMRTENDYLDDIIFRCLSNMPIKTMDIFGKPVEKNRIVDSYVKKIKELINNKSDMGTLKSEILDIVYRMPLAMQTCNKIAYLNVVVDSLMKNLDTHTQQKINVTMTKRETPAIQNVKVLNNSLKLYVQPTEDELKEFLAEELGDFLEKNDIREDTPEVVVEIIDFLIDSIESIRSGECQYDNFVEEMIMLLHQEIANLSLHQARTFTLKILKKIEGVFSLDNSNKDNTIKLSRQSNSPLQSSLNNFTSNNGLQDSSDLGLMTINKEDKDANSDIYKHQLTQQIDQWLIKFNMHSSHANDIRFQQVIASDLANEIINRRKYLVLNPSSKATYESELEQLKYQIFKWTNKLAGENNMETIEHAPELMQRIQRIPIHTLLQGQQNNAQPDICLLKQFPIDDVSECNNSYTAFNENRNTNQVLPISTSVKSNKAMSYNQSLPNNASISCCSGSHSKPSTPSMKQLNDEYDEFLKNWVQEVPIPSSTANEKAVADKARMGIYNGIWKAITKLKFEPATFNNPFGYEDALDDAIEELLSSLPKTQELESKKHLLKVQLIEKTTNTNELIKSSSAPSSFRQQLIESVSNSLPRKNITANVNENLKPSYEELQIFKLVEDYILCTRYKDEDKIKANIYRKKLIKEVQTLIKNLKKTHEKELQEIDPDIYTNSILDALHKVPLPNEETVKDEADEILLSLEVEQWLSDLPLLQNNDLELKTKMKKIKDQLVKKLLEIEREVDIYDCTGERVLKHELSMFLHKIPIQEEHNSSISFMAEEFANRLKNRPKLHQGNGSRKSVAFLDSVGYFEFSRNMPHCSSFSKLPGARPALRDQSSYMIRDGSIVRDTSSMQDDRYRPQTNANFGQAPYPPLSSDQFFTLEESPAPKPQNQPVVLQPRVMLPPATARSERWNTIPDASIEWQSIPIASQLLPMPMTGISNAQGSPERQLSPCCRNAPNSQHETTLSHQAVASHVSPLDTRSVPVQDQYNRRHSLPLQSKGMPDQHSQRYSLPSEWPSMPINTMSRTRVPELPPIPMAAISNVQHSPERQLSPCCRNATNLQHQSTLPNQAVSYVPPLNAVPVPDQYDQRHSLPPEYRGIPDQYSQRYSLPLNIPMEFQNPCCAREQENANSSRINSPIRKSSPSPRNNDPPAIRGASQADERQMHPGQYISDASLQSESKQPMQRSCRETSQQRLPNDMLVGEVNQDLLGPVELNQQGLPSNMSTYGDPQGFSTPQQVIMQGSPPRPGRKKTRKMQNYRKDFARRRLDLEDDTEDDLESERDEPCPCMRRMFRCQRGPLCYDDYETDGPQCFPMPMPYGCQYCY